MLHEIKLTTDLAEGSVTEINVKVGDQVQPDTLLASINADKVDLEIMGEEAGTVEAINISKGDKVVGGQVLFVIKLAASANAVATETPAAPKVEAVVEVKAETPAPVVVAAAPKAEVASLNPNLHASPLAKLRAKDLGIDINTVKSSSPTGRISVEDVLAHAKKLITETPKTVVSAIGGGIAYKPLPDFSKFGKVTVEPMSSVGKATADNMTYAWQTIPHAWISEKADVTKLEKMRQQYKERVKKEGGSLTITAIITKAVAVLLHRYPTFNCSVDMEKHEIHFKDFVNIGVAVDTERGLLVPVIKNADKKGFTEIAKDLAELSVRTRDKKNKADDFEGGTFTISNIGGIGGTHMVSIINPPQVAILAVTAAQTEAVWNGEAFEPRQMMQMTIGFDHRAINGADTARFLRDLKEMLEDPFLMSF